MKLSGSVVKLTKGVVSFTPRVLSFTKRVLSFSRWFDSLIGTVDSFSSFDVNAMAVVESFSRAIVGLRTAIVGFLGRFDSALTCSHGFSIASVAP